MKTNKQNKSISSKVLETVGKPSIVKIAVLSSALAFGTVQAYEKMDKSFETYQIVNEAYKNKKIFY
jgi:hypothetical protein